MITLVSNFVLSHFVPWTIYTRSSFLDLAIEEKFRFLLSLEQASERNILRQLDDYQINTFMLVLVLLNLC